MKQKDIAKRLGISKSYLSMVLRGQRAITPQLLDKLQRTPEVHKIVNFKAESSLARRRSIAELLPHASHIGAEREI